jgi:hypothetical protein
MQTKSIMETLGMRAGFGAALLIFVSILYHILSGFNIIHNIKYLSVISVVLMTYLFVVVIGLIVKK